MMYVNQINMTLISLKGIFMSREFFVYEFIIPLN